MEVNKFNQSKNGNESPYYAIYSRKSKFTGKGESIDNQIELCKNQLINKYKIDVNNIKVYQDEGFTGYNTNRPQFQKMLKEMHNKKIKCIIVYKLDRISRNVTDFCNLKNEFLKYNVDFISVTENFDTSTPMGSAMLMMSSVFAQLERDTIAERIKDNMYELAKTGRWLGGTTPLGYKSKKIENLSIDGKKRSLYQLEIIPEEAEVIKLIWNKMSELKGLGRLESYLLQKGIKTRNGNNFTRFSLITILKNPVYVIADDKIKDFFCKMNVSIYENDGLKCDGIHGLIAYNKREELIGKTKSYKNISEWIIAVGKHLGIISSQQFIKVWNLIENNKNKRCRTPQQNTSILSGIIRCKFCGSYMRPRLRNSIALNGERNFTYLCELKDKSRKQLCQCKNINGIETDKLVIQKIKELTIPIEDFIKRLKLIADSKEKEATKKQNELQTLNATLTRNKMKIELLIDRMTIIDVNLINDVSLQVKALKFKNTEIKKRMAELTKEINQETDQKKITSLALDMIDKYMNSFDTLDIVDKRTMVKLLVNSVESNGENVYINYIGSSNTVMCPQSDGS
mgnify:CR=1 FL=1